MQVTAAIARMIENAYLRGCSRAIPPDALTPDERHLLLEPFRHFISVDVALIEDAVRALSSLPVAERLPEPEPRDVEVSWER